MNELPDSLCNEIIKYLNVHSFINYCCLNKKSEIQCKDYLSYMKGLYTYQKTKKTYKNCLYVLDIPNNKKRIVKIVKIKEIPKNIGYEKKKIYFWVLSTQEIVGNNLVIYPDWAIIKNVKDENLIPFY